MNMCMHSLVGAMTALLGAGIAQASCGSAFCVLDTNWSALGVASEPGTVRLDLRYEFIEQKHLRSGSRQISAAEDTADTTELRTINRNLLATLDYALSDHWTVSAQAPIVSRSHSHIADPAGAASLEAWSFTEIGDSRLLGFYRFDHPDPAVNYGLIMGLKLPTGDYRVRNAEGALAERALQPGTGSTDLVLGGYYSAPGAHLDSSWFAQALAQQAAATKDGFKPGAQYLLSLGYRHPVSESWHALLQVNASVKARDTGVNAEPDLSGSDAVFLSPGLAYALSHDAQIYGFVQLPVYRHVNGVQLSANWALIAGVSVRF
jgi:hypothetical protein